MVAQISPNLDHKPLGTVLKEAGLISDHQIQVALQDQRFDQSLLFGQILALRGWVAQETADFFAVDLPQIKQQNKREKIGFYLKKAKLLTDEQINSILQEQKQNFIRFASLAVLKGFLKQKTLDFLSENLFQGYADSSYFMTFDPQEKVILTNGKPVSIVSEVQPDHTQISKQNEQKHLSSVTHLDHAKETYIQSDIDTYIQLDKDTYIQSDIEDELDNNNGEIKWIN